MLVYHVDARTVKLNPLVRRLALILSQQQPQNMWAAHFSLYVHNKYPILHWQYPRFDVLSDTGRSRPRRPFDGHWPSNFSKASDPLLLSSLILILSYFQIRRCKPVAKSLGVLFGEV